MSEDTSKQRPCVHSDEDEKTCTGLQTFSDKTPNLGWHASLDSKMPKYVRAWLCDKDPDHFDPV
jgi:hypothetical protein